MQTAKFVYLIMWALIVLPLFGFNVKRLSERKFGEKRKIKWPFIAFMTVLMAFVTIFLISAYRVTLDTRYELAAERYIDLHAEYITGQIEYDEYISQSTPLLEEGADTAGFTDSLAALDKREDIVRFQISSWITPKYYQDEESFPKVEVIDANNPVFVIYLIDDGTAQTYYLIEMVWHDDGGWKIAYQASATKEQFDAGEKALPSQINGKWFSVSA